MTGRDPAGMNIRQRSGNADGRIIQGKCIRKRGSRQSFPFCIVSRNAVRGLLITRAQVQIRLEWEYVRKYTATMTKPTE